LDLVWAFDSLIRYHAGISVALSYNGTRLLVNVPLGQGVDDPNEVVYIYTRNASHWHLEEILKPR
jgi:hypothetical protein